MSMEEELHEHVDEGDVYADDLTQTEQRSLVFHLLYAVDAFDYDISLESVTDNFARGFGTIIPSTSGVFEKAEAIIKERDKLDQLIFPLIENWRPERIGTPTKLIMRLALWELCHTKTDPAIVINEAVELAKCFAERDAFKFINGVLDEYVKRASA